MALIGFRSPLTYHPWPWSEYTEEQKKMFNVRPGITGWAQVNGRKTVEWNKRIELNGWYIVDTTKAWKIEKNSVFCGGCIVYFLEYRFCIHSIYTDSRKKNV